MGKATIAWLGGWMMLTASIVTIAAVALAYWFVPRHKTGVLASHAAIERELASDAAPAAS